MSINVMHAKPDLRVVLKWKIIRPGSVIADVIQIEVSHARLMQSCARP